MNNVSLVGRLTKDPEVRQARNGNACLLFQLAVDRGVRSNSGEKLVDFVPCSAWSMIADYIGRYAKKGDLLSVIGKIQTRQQVTQNGNTEFRVEVVLSFVTLLNPRPQERVVQAPIPDPEDDDGLPF